MPAAIKTIRHENFECAHKAYYRVVCNDQSVIHVSTNTNVLSHTSVNTILHNRSDICDLGSYILVMIRRLQSI